MLVTLVGFASGDGRLAFARSSAPRTLELTPPLSCWHNDRYPLVSAESPSDLRSVNLYFRCSPEADFYFLEMVQENGVYRTGLPIADGSCPAVSMFVEGIGFDFIRVRTEEVTVPVQGSGECEAPAFDGVPDLEVRKQRAESPDAPPGFQNPAMAQVGGVGVGTAGAVAIAAAAGAGIGYLALRDEPLDACFKALLEEGGGISGPTFTPLQEPLRVEMTRRFSFGQPFVVLRFDATCSKPSGGITAYRWDFGNGGLSGLVIDSNTYTEVGTYTVSLTVSDGSRQATTTKTLKVALGFSSLHDGQSPDPAASAAGALETSAMSFFETPDPKELQARIHLNAAPVATFESSGPLQLRFFGRAGRNVVEGYAAKSVEPGGIWRFDFSSAKHFVPASIEVGSGYVMARGTDFVVFSLSGSSNARVRFTFELVP
jgi:hypothetical protein